MSEDNRADLLYKHDLAILSALDEQGALDTGTVSRTAFPDAYSRRQTSGAVRSWLSLLRARGLVDRADDKRPAIWVRTPAGTAALERQEK